MNISLTKKKKCNYNKSKSIIYRNNKREKARVNKITQRKVLIYSLRIEFCKYTSNSCCSSSSSLNNNSN
jgi:hypothetical protein